MIQRNQKQTAFIPRGSPHGINDLLEQRPREQQLYEELQKRNAQLSVLEVVNSRLSQKLLELQAQVGVQPEDIAKQLEALDEFPMGSMVDPDQMPYLQALFTAYDDSNLKQKKLIGRLYTQLGDLQKRSQVIVRDNAFLMQELENKCKVILQIYGNGFPQEHLAGIYLKLQKQDLELKQSTLIDQNDYLNHSYKGMQIKYFQTNKELQITKRQLEEYFENFKTQSEKLKSTEIGSSQMQSKLDYLVKQFRKSTDENASLQARCVEFEQKIIGLNNQLNLTRKQLQNTKRAAKDTEEQLKQQLNNLQQKTGDTQHKERNQFNQIMTLEKQLESQRDNAKKYKRQNQQNKKNLQDTLKMIETYQLKVSHSIKKQESIEKQLRVERQEAQSALLERDKAILRQQQLEKQIEAQVARNKQDLQSLKQSYEKIIKTQGQRVQQIQDSLQQSELDKQNVQSTMKNVSDRHRRQLTQMRQQNQRLSKQLRSTNCQQLINKAREGEDRAESLKRVLEHNQKSHRDQLQQKMDIIRRLQSQNREISRILDKERNLVKQLTSERNSLKSNNTKLTKQLNILTEESDHKRKGIDAKMVVLQSEQQNKIREMEDRFNQRLQKQKEARQRAVQKLESYQQLQRELKGEFESRVRQLQNQNQILKQKLLVKKR